MTAKRAENRQPALGTTSLQVVIIQKVVYSSLCYDKLFIPVIPLAFSFKYCLVFTGIPSVKKICSHINLNNMSSLDILTCRIKVS